MIIDVLPEDYVFKICSPDWTQRLLLDPPGHLAIEFMRPYEKCVFKDSHQRMMDEVLKNYPQLLHRLVLPYYCYATWYPLKCNSKRQPISLRQPISFQNIKNEHNLVYYLDKQSWSGWQSFS